ncbi:MAG: hypothetical protein F6K41_32820, partial [Symploca sp. SIO3E6]|nr:hypothetical protein [Caldora sp. SIO3E6]
YSTSVANPLLRVLQIPDFSVPTVINQDKPVKEVGDLPPARLLIIANYNNKRSLSAPACVDRLL